MKFKKSNLKLLFIFVMLSFWASAPITFAEVDESMASTTDLPGEMSLGAVTDGLIFIGRCGVTFCATYFPAQMLRGSTPFDKTFWFGVLAGGTTFYFHFLNAPLSRMVAKRNWFGRFARGPSLGASLVSEFEGLLRVALFLELPYVVPLKFAAVGMGLDHATLPEFLRDLSLNVFASQFLFQALLASQFAKENVREKFRFPARARRIELSTRAKNALVSGITNFVLALGFLGWGHSHKVFLALSVPAALYVDWKTEGPCRRALTNLFKRKLQNADTP